MLFLSLLGTLMIMTLPMLKLIEAQAAQFADVASLQNPTIKAEDKFQEVFGCKDNSTCGAQLQNFPFVLPFP
jgi:hypothetical protein